MASWLLLTVGTAYSQLSISVVRALPVGSVVTTTGTITSDDAFGLVRYLQDQQAGIALYGAALDGFQPGDSVLVSGVLSQYRGQLQLSPINSIQLITTGKPVEALVEENVEFLSTDEYESRKVIIPCSGISSCEFRATDGWYTLYDQFGHTCRLWIAFGTPAYGYVINSRPVTIEGIWTRFEDQYQLMAQVISDASEGACHLLAPPEITFVDSKPLLSWKDIPMDKTEVWIGIDSLETSLDQGVAGGDLNISLDMLTPGEVYQTRLAQEDAEGNRFYSPTVCFAPPSISAPDIEILFNRSIDASFSDGSAPLAYGSSAIETDLIQRLDQVSSTLDIAMYNTSRSNIAQAISRAVQRGVTVRYIAEASTSNSAIDGALNFPVYFRDGDGIMHNKFVIADADIPQQAWLWTGSTNFSSNQLSSDPNHAYIIHDQAIAKSYRKEFEEIWGRQANHSDGHFGDFKTDNTVHQFQIGDMLVESYFSPSDETNCHILEALQSADYQVEIGLLLLTKEDLIDQIIALHDNGIDIRVILDDESSSSTAVARLRQAQIPLAIHDFSPIFHHKYAIIDEGHPDSDPTVISGSHNWTWSADNINDENTLIFHDQSVANIFRQEFEARWEELNPTATEEFETKAIMPFPNPASAWIQLSNPFDQPCSIELFNIMGHQLYGTQVEAQSDFILNLNPGWISGVYVLKTSWPDHQTIHQIRIVHPD